jgi:hypothetical protein
MTNYEIEKDLVETLRSIFNYSNTNSCTKNNHIIVKFLNIHRYCELLLAKNALDNILHKEGEQETFEIKFVPEFSYGTLSAELDWLTIRDKKAFAIAMSRADNFEIYPLTNGRIRAVFTFHAMFKRICKEK